MRRGYRSKRNKFVCTVANCELDDAVNTTRQFAHDIGWSITDTIEKSRRFGMTFENPENGFVKLLVSKDPQVCKIGIERGANDLEIVIGFTHKEKFSFNIALVTVVAMFSALFGAILVQLPLLGPGREVIFFVPIAVSTFANLWKVKATEYELFVSRLRRTFLERGYTATIDSRKFAPPGRFPLAFHLFSLASIFAGIAYNTDFPKAGEVSLLAQIELGAIYVYLAGCAIAIVFGFALIFRREETSAKFMAVPQFLVGLAFAAYMAVPLGLVYYGLDAVDEKLTSPSVLSPIFSIGFFTLGGLSVALILYIPVAHSREANARRQLGTESSFVFSPMLAMAFVPALWLTTGSINILAVFHVLGGAETIFFGQAFIFDSAVIRGIDRFYGSPGIAVYLFPIIFILTLTFRAARQQRRKIRHSLLVPENVSETVNEVCERTNMKPPTIILVQSQYAHAGAAHSFKLGPFIFLTDRLLTILGNDELAGVLAHELWHIKRHTFVFWLGDTISQFTLFGRGFHTVMFNTAEMELKADDFATDYLMCSGSKKSALAQALRKIAMDTKILQLLAPSESLVSLLPISDLETWADMDRVSMKERLSWLHRAIFGDLAVSYYHPSSEYRINRIESQCDAA